MGNGQTVQQIFSLFDKAMPLGLPSNKSYPFKHIASALVRLSGMVYSYDGTVLFSYGRNKMRKSEK
jgi:hypothetical protein